MSSVVTVSILMPVKNGEKFINETVSSISEQSYSDWELIIVDDHSTDSTVDIISSFCGEDSRIRQYTNPGQGILPALEYALSQANGSYVTRMDADDLMPKDRIQLMVNAISSQPTKTIVTGLIRYFGLKVSDGYRAYEEWINDINLQNRQWTQVYRECVIASPNWMIRREELDLNQLQYPEDYDLVFDWYQKGFHIHCIPKVTLYWREHPDRTSRNNSNYQQRAFFNLKIQKFIELDLQNGNLCLWGNNLKSQLTKHILKSENIPFRQFDLTNYQSLTAVKDVKLLVAVWPDPAQRKKIEAFLHENGLEQGRHWWYL
ncbi:glycosyltransferase involved in cell wall biosynthesis [Marinoscillum furvescens DSM 4134]|uniref:Glycosyltransferase involved in cell wall biosynthesis n=1 Tax=Marinoscillum furvescens DSM 4134 TaxID=1122208 RepID=A0A3D9L178_MARFU|nr:glycosyltransferase involved in cell wall biosynthesis [Marinoscillum furvescens DSM 4134]